MARLFRVDFGQNMRGQGMLNTRYYWSENGEALPLGNFLADTIVDSMVLLQSTQLAHTIMTITDVLGVVAPAIIDMSAYVGEAVSDELPVFNSVGLFFPVLTNLTRGGSNRVPGVTEAQVTDGELDPVYEAVWGAIASALGTAVTIGVADYFPVVAKFTLGRWLSNGIAGGVLSALTTQNSRKKYTSGASGVQFLAPTSVKVHGHNAGSVAGIEAYLQTEFEGAPEPVSGGNKLFPRYDDIAPVVIVNA